MTSSNIAGKLVVVAQKLRKQEQYEEGYGELFVMLHGEMIVDNKFLRFF